MPIPVSVTGFARAAGASTASEELVTAGPFARRAAEAAEPPAAATSPLAPAAAAPPPAPPAASSDAPLVVVSGLTFRHCGLDGRPLSHAPPVIADASFLVPRGATVLLLGGNGAGKSTLLRVLAGKTFVPPGTVLVLGRDAFHDTGLECSGALGFIGGQWAKDVAFAGYSVPLTGDFPASKMLDSVPGVDPGRKARLLRLLDIDPAWRMHRVSDGQRRRVQLAFGLLRPFQLLLLDEVTVDLDALARAELMSFLRSECQTRGASVIVATHIFDGLENWASHLARLSRGRLTMAAAGEVTQLTQGFGGRLFPYVEAWLREEAAAEAAAGKGAEAPRTQLVNNGWGAGRAFTTTLAQR